MNDIDKLPVKCRDCPYWELASYPWCCGDCTEKMNPKNSEYIKRGDAKRALTALPADLDAETIQRCIEAMNNPKAADVEPKQRWIPVTERLPECEVGAEIGNVEWISHDMVFAGCFGRGGKYRDAYFRTWTDTTEGIDAKDADCWRVVTLPEPQKGENDGTSRTE